MCWRLVDYSNKNIYGGGDIRRPIRGQKSNWGRLWGGHAWSAAKGLSFDGLNFSVWNSSTSIWVAGTDHSQRKKVRFELKIAVAQKPKEMKFYFHASTFQLKRMT